MKGKILQGILVAMAVGAAGVHAQDCPRIADPAKRLECYDRAGGGRQKAPKAGSDEAKIQDAVRMQLRDPDSAQFGSLTLVGPDRACQTFNARNSFGGYTGSKQAAVMKVDGAWLPIGIHDVTHVACIDAVKKLP